MKRTASILSLLALLALVPCAQCVAQTMPTAAPPASPVPTATAPADIADFLATLSGAQNSTPAAGGFQWTTCTDHDDCPAGQLCCYPCGIDGCPFVCMTPERGRCPHFP